MKNNEARLKIIKDTVANSVLSEINEKLMTKVTNEKKRSELISFTRLRLQDILSSLDQDEVLSKQEIRSREDFMKHIQKVIRKVKQKLISEIEQEFLEQ